MLTKIHFQMVRYCDDLHYNEMIGYVQQSLTEFFLHLAHVLIYGRDKREKGVYGITSRGYESLVGEEIRLSGRRDQ